ncbi:MAG: MBOAT family O-acyltransferase [Planctomycetota bacterium]|jgi:D-alanyl-lipoteichoic acid acyltransferase DltB (MBOAT superfamily)
MCWKIEYVFLIIASTISVYVAGILLEKLARPSHKNVVLLITLLFNTGILFVFKYFNFFNDSLRIALNTFNIFYDAPRLKLLLPVGISFYTFQVISYLIDVYRGEKSAEKHLGFFALFVAFFPKLIAGPIERARNLLPQFHEKHEFDNQRITDGLKLVAWGLFKKMVIADRLAVYVNQIYDNPGDHAGVSVILATVFFTYQIYCDFSGYSDIAIGSAQVLGFRLMKNFDRPYSAKSISEFWRRWHISLSTWLNDYIYTPILIRTREWGQKAILFSIITTFLVCGLWHGANWTFVIWGLLHGLMLSLEVITKKSRKKVRKKVPKLIYDNISILFVFSFVCFAHLFFRANSVDDAFQLIRNIFSIDFKSLDLTVPQMGRFDLFIAFVSIAILEIVQAIQCRIQIRQYIAERKLLVRWTVYVVFVSYILVFRMSGSEFIYFQF